MILTASKKPSKPKEPKTSPLPEIANSLPPDQARAELDARIIAAKEIIAAKPRTDVELKQMEERINKWDRATESILW